MKIYASRQHDDQAFLESLVGQDIWVLCHNYPCAMDMYVRVLSLQDNDSGMIIKYNRACVPDLVNGLYDLDSLDPYDQVDNNLSWVYSVNSHDLYIKWPTELLSSNEVREYMVNGGCPL